jgi:hypothetical protein
VRFFITIVVSLCAYSSAIANYELRDFILWDYRDDAPSDTSLHEYHQWLLTFCETNPPPRLILYVTDPCNPDPSGTDGWLKFYDPTAGVTDSDGNLTLVGFLKQLNATVPDVELLIDYASFSVTVSPDPMNTCWQGSPSGTTMNPTWLPSVFSRIPNAMGWLEALMQNPILQGSNPVTALALDPEGSGGTPEYVNLMLWLDKYKATVASSQVKALDISMTLAFEAHTLVKNCVAELPTPLASGSLWPASLWTNMQANSGIASYYNFIQQGNGFLPWRSTTQPLLQRAYLQVYSACVAQRTPGAETSEFWRFASTNADCDCSETLTYTIQDPATIASNLVDVMQRTPSACGKGTIEASVSGKFVTLIGTNSILPFMEGYSRIYLEGTSGPIPNAGVWKYMASDPPLTDTAVVVGPAQDSSSLSLPYKYTEISIDFRAPAMTDTSPDRIILMFSAEKNGLLPFFGWGTPGLFYSFVDNFYNFTQATSDPATVYMGGNGGLPVPHNRFAIYDLKQMCDNWNLCTYGITPCVGDGSQDGVIDIDDILHGISYFGSSEPSADHDGNGVVNVKDLLLIVHNWGVCP